MPKFTKYGGRAGFVHVVDGEREGRMEFELLVGKCVAMIIGRGSRWVVPEVRAMTHEELQTLCKALAASERASLLLCIGADAQQVDP